jgi:HIRAN domain
MFAAAGKPLEVQMLKVVMAEAELRIAVVQGDGQFGMRVAGTSHHQLELETLAGGRSEQSAHHKCAVLLLPEPDNPYDPNAVAVYIVASSQKTAIGYLHHDTAPLFNKCLLCHGFSAGACNALIVGGWHREDGSEDGNFGVRLDAYLPFQLDPLAIPDAGHAAPINSQPIQIAALPQK